MPYVPPHRKPKPLKPEVRFKVLVIPRIGDKIVVVRDAKSGELTVPGGGCPPRYKNNLRNCAAKELSEETRRSIIQNRNSIQPFFSFRTKNRPPDQKLNDNKRGIIVTTVYTVYTVEVGSNFKNIENSFKTKSQMTNFEKNSKEYSETSEILLMSTKNLRDEQKVYSIIRNHVLPHI
jgi:ADP-ribose pyrophosphatase YjhB (NUDIX family)